MHQSPEPVPGIPPPDPAPVPLTQDAVTYDQTSAPEPIPAITPAITPGIIPATTPGNIPAGTGLPADEPVLWKERLYPNFGVWVIIVGLAFVPAVIFAPIDMTIGVIASVITLLVLVIMLMTSIPSILVTRSVLQVGRARIDRMYVGTAEAFTKEEATQQRGTGLHGLTYLCIRGWIDPVVKIEITDKEDPAPYWLVSSRHPDELAELLTTPTPRN